MLEVSKSGFKPRVLEFLRRVEQTGEPVVITDRGRPVVVIRPYVEDPEVHLAPLRGSVLHFDAPTEPVDVDEWDALR